MVEYILGNYLVEKGTFTSAQLRESVEKMDQVRVKLGLIAVAEGMMTNEQAEEVNRLQSTMDKRFGDIAVEKGYLTDEQIGNLLKQQGNTYLAFAQVLVDSGYVKMEDIDGILEDFRRENGFSRSEMEWLKSDEADRIVPMYLPPEAADFKELVGVAVRTVIRCIDRHVYIGKASMTGELELCGAAMQVLEGESGVTAAFLESSGGLLQLASVFGREEFSAIDEDSLDAAGEFLNCVDGLYVSPLSQQGVKLELMPPELITEKRILKGKVCRVPVFVNDKELEFVVMEEQ
ncbi:MAG: hypothetical protein NC180_00750 [Muribaculaceae bacterium]|nr:hypothetical protein [Roseburia sp.]MCM1430897.1 hypothetical protein [Muribaculaceae bacterium]MCM1491742.1 hypothetical protein [Muribaculaceae bacterium]